MAKAKSTFAPASFASQIAGAILDESTAINAARGATLQKVVALVKACPVTFSADKFKAELAPALTAALEKGGYAVPGMMVSKIKTIMVVCTHESGRELLDGAYGSLNALVEVCREKGPELGLLKVTKRGAKTDGAKAGETRGKAGKANGEPVKMDHRDICVAAMGMVEEDGHVMHAILTHPDAADELRAAMAKIYKKHKLNTPNK